MKTATQLPKVKTMGIKLLIALVITAALFAVSLAQPSFAQNADDDKAQTAELAISGGWNIATGTILPVIYAESPTVAGSAKRLVPFPKMI